MLAATKSMAEQYWQNMKDDYDFTSKVASILNEIKEATSRYCTTTPIPFTKESFLKNIDFDNIDPEKVLEYINFNDGIIDDEVTDMGLNYWKDPDTAAFGWKTKGHTPLGPEKAELVYEISVGGPNVHLIFFHDLEYQKPFEHGHDIPEPNFTRSEFQYHWWSRLNTIDTTNDADAQECYEQIKEEAIDMFERNYKHPKIVGINPEERDYLRRT